jgi:hypothetical protein
MAKAAQARHHVPHDAGGADVPGDVAPPLAVRIGPSVPSRCAARDCRRGRRPAGRARRWARPARRRRPVSSGVEQSYRGRSWWLHQSLSPMSIESTAHSMPPASAGHGRPARPSSMIRADRTNSLHAPMPRPANPWRLQSPRLSGSNPLCPRWDRSALVGRIGGEAERVHGA